VFPYDKISGLDMTIIYIWDPAFFGYKITKVKKNSIPPGRHMGAEEV